MPQASEYLVEIDAHTGAASTTLRYGTCTYVTKPGDTPANTVFKGVIIDAGSFTQHMFSNSRTMGEASMELGDLSLANMDGGLDALLGYRFDGRAVRLLRVSPDAAFSTSVLVYLAVVERLDAMDGDILRLRFYDRRREIDKPLLVNRYGGTTTGAGNSADGPPDMAGQLKQKVWGRALNVEAVIPNPFDPILQFTDGAANAIELFDGGVALINDGDSGSISALRAASINPGHYRTCLALGLARPGGTLGNRPAFVWTAHVTVGATTPDRTAGKVAEQLLAHMGLTGGGNIDATAFAALNASATAEVGVLVSSEASALTVIREVLDSVGAYLTVDSLGRFTVGRLLAPGSPVGSISSRHLLDGQFGLEANPDTDGGLPARQVRIRWGRYWKVHSESEIAGCVAEDDPARAAALAQEYREAVVSNAGVLAAHPLAPELSINTLLVNKADAETEVARRNGLYGVTRYVTSGTVPREDAVGMVLGATVTLAPDRLDLDGGRNMVVIGRQDNYAAETVTLTLWG